MGRPQVSAWRVGQAPGPVSTSGILLVMKIVAPCGAFVILCPVAKQVARPAPRSKSQVLETQQGFESDQETLLDSETRHRLQKLQRSYSTATSPYSETIATYSGIILLYSEPLLSYLDLIVSYSEIKSYSETIPSYSEIIQSHSENLRRIRRLFGCI